MFTGKTAYIWNRYAIEGGNPERIAKVALDLGLDGICIKAANSSWAQVSRNSQGQYVKNVTHAFMEAMRDARLNVYFWHYVYGYSNSFYELEIAIEQYKTFRPDGYIWNAEGSFDSKPNAPQNATNLAKGFKHGTGCPQALCWWALPLNPSNLNSEWHPIAVAKAFLEYVDVGMPMMYWQGDRPLNAPQYFIKSMAIWRSFTNRPIVPIGRAYDGDGGKCSSEGIKLFSEVVKENTETLRLFGLSWYSLDEIVKKPSWMDAIRSSFSVDPPKVLTLEEQVERLVEAHPELF